MLLEEAMMEVALAVAVAGGVREGAGVATQLRGSMKQL